MAAAGRFVDMESLDDDIQAMIRKSIEAQKMAYTPYSNFKVGAAVLCEDGTIICGCNVENSSFPVGTCAERSAISSAISKGKHTFQAISVAAAAAATDNGGMGAMTFPCGMCRQFLSEFGDLSIYLTNPTMTRVLQTSVSALLPFCFKLTPNE